MNIKLLIHFIFLCFGISSTTVMNCYYFHVASEDRVLAFPGAEGAGKYTNGGHGSEIIEVTNLNDSGPGSKEGNISLRR